MPDLYSALFFVGLTLLLQAYLLWQGLKNSADSLALFGLYANLALLTLGVVPAIWYLQEALSSNPEALFFQMKIHPSHYFAFALPSLGSVIWGMHKSKKTGSQEDQTLIKLVQQYLERTHYLPWVLLTFGFFMQELSPFLSTSLRQLGHFGASVLWVGALHVFFAPVKPWQKGLVGLFLLSNLVFSAIKSTFFGALIFWPLLLALYVQLYYRLSARILLISLVAVVLAVFLLFSFKYEYRSRLWQNPQQAHHLRHLWDAIKHPWQHPEAWQNTTQTFLARLNQGRHLALVYHWVPRHEPFANGETFVTAGVAALVPRAFWPNKPIAADRNKWIRFTGHQLGPNTSSNIGVLGDAYANFGFLLGLPWLWLWGKGLASLYHLLRKLAIKYYPCLWLWVPLIFSGLIDQENDLMIQLNHAVKGGIFTLTFCYCLYRIDCLRADVHGLKTKSSNAKTQE